MIMLGNLSVEQIQERLGIVFPYELIGFMEKSRQLEADNIQKGKWHCFDIPFHIVCGDLETATKIYDLLKDKSSECKRSLVFSIQEPNNLENKENVCIEESSEINKEAYNKLTKRDSIDLKYKPYNPMQ